MCKYIPVYESKVFIHRGTGAALKAGLALVEALVVAFTEMRMHGWHKPRGNARKFYGFDASSNSIPPKFVLPPNLKNFFYHLWRVAANA